MNFVKFRITRCSSETIGEEDTTYGWAVQVQIYKAVLECWVTKKR